MKANLSRKRSFIRKIVLFLTLLSSPFLCYGFAILLTFMPSSILPPAADFGMNVFRATAVVENRTGETLYITPITTTYGHPQVIVQPKLFRQRDIPLEPNQSIELGYDTADSVLAGIVVCRAALECRWSEAKGSDVYKIEAFAHLAELPPGWMDVVQSYPHYNLTVTIMLGLSLVPIMLLTVWWYLGNLERGSAG